MPRLFMLLFLGAVLYIPIHAHAQISNMHDSCLEVLVLRVIDGDTMVVMISVFPHLHPFLDLYTREVIRLRNIDTPEKPNHEPARLRLAHYAGESVLVCDAERGVFSPRFIADVCTRDKKNIAHMLLKEGTAGRYKDKPPPIVSCE